jgi:hypothetical protein
MSAPKHTPGPWRVANGTQIRSQRDQIAKVWMMRDGEGNSNARLIAAAPEMLEALKAMAEGCSFPADDVQRAIRDRARAAIAKATGGEA